MGPGQGSPTLPFGHLLQSPGSQTPPRSHRGDPGVMILVERATSPGNPGIGEESPGTWGRAGTLPARSREEARSRCLPSLPAAVAARPRRARRRGRDGTGPDGRGRGGRPGGPSTAAGRCSHLVAALSIGSGEGRGEAAGGDSPASASCKASPRRETAPLPRTRPLALGCSSALLGGGYRGTLGVGAHAGTLRGVAGLSTQGCPSLGCCSSPWRRARTCSPALTLSRGALELRVRMVMKRVLGWLCRSTAELLARTVKLSAWARGVSCLYWICCFSTCKAAVG